MGHGGHANQEKEGRRERERGELEHPDATQRVGGTVVDVERLEHSATYCLPVGACDVQLLASKIFIVFFIQIAHFSVI